MKKSILFLAIASLFLSCSGSDSSGNSSGNSFTNSMDYEFTITVNGEAHKVKGNTTDGMPTAFGYPHEINNQCAVINSTEKSVMLKINDVTAVNYISGQNLECRIILPNLLMGINQAQVMFFGSYFDSIYTNLGYTNPTQGNCNFSIVRGGAFYSVNNKLPITITDLGTNTTIPQTPPLPYFNFGETIKGNYTGTIYLWRQQSPSTGTFIYDVPVSLSIDFKALRMY